MPETTFTNPAEDRRELNAEARRSYSGPGIDAADRIAVLTEDAYREGARRVRVKGCACEHCAALPTDDGRIDHLPGSDWHGFEYIRDPDNPLVRGEWREKDAPVTAPAPKRTVTLWHAPLAKTDLAALRTGEGASDWTRPDAILATVQVAVKRLCGGRGYWEREDCISYCVARLLNAERRTGRPADVLRYIDRAERMPLTTGERAGIPTRALTPLALARLVADWSRREASRHAESIEAAQESGAHMSMSDARTTDHAGRSVDGAPVPAPALPQYAAARACDMLTTQLGVGTIGGVWEALYCVIRDITTEDAAGELATTHAALRAKTSRGAKWIRTNLPTPADLRRALDWFTDPTTRSRKMPERPLREGTNAGRAPVRPTDVHHARALCASVVLPARESTTTDAERVRALLAA